MSTELAFLNQEITELKELVLHGKANRLNDSLYSKELAPHYMQLAGQLSKSQMVPKAYQGKPQDLFVAMAMGYQIGLSVEQAVQAIAVINGKPCLWGDDMLALCMAHPDFVDIVESPIMKGDDIVGYECTVHRKGMSAQSASFTLNMAKKAGLLSKVGPWTQYPERMLQLRARAYALRNRFPDAIKGIKSREEVEDYIDAEYKVVDTASSSRSEQLKKDFLTKTGQLNNEIVDTVQDVPPQEETVESEQHQGVVEVGESTLNLSDEIKKLIEETGFSDERLIKALSFYEADSIASLSTESAKHFIAQLERTII